VVPIRKNIQVPIFHKVVIGIVKMGEKLVIALWIYWFWISIVPVTVTLIVIVVISVIDFKIFNSALRTSVIQSKPAKQFILGEQRL
jgi:hypothetical protein